MRLGLARWLMPLLVIQHSAPLVEEYVGGDVDDDGDVDGDVLSLQSLRGIVANELSIVDFVDLPAQDVNFDFYKDYNRKERHALENKIAIQRQASAKYVSGFKNKKTYKKSKSKYKRK